MDICTEELYNMQHSISWITSITFNIPYAFLIDDLGKSESKFTVKRFLTWSQIQ